MASDAPIATVYVHNLEERVKIEPLKEALDAIFSEFGPVVDIIAKTNLRAKGQAFIVFKDPADARRAVAEAQGFELFDKPMVLALARTPSDATVAATAAARSDADADALLAAHKARRMAERDRRRALAAAEAEKRQMQKQAAQAQAAAAAAAAAADGGGGDAGNAAAAAAAALAAIPDEYLPPNKTLFVQNLPAAECDTERLTERFGQFGGFREVRVVPGRGLAFVEYETEGDAVRAKESTHGTVLDDAAAADGTGKRVMKVTYQRQ